MANVIERVTIADISLRVPSSVSSETALLIIMFVFVLGACLSLLNVFPKAWRRVLPLGLLELFS